MLEGDLRSQLRGYLGNLREPIELVASLDYSDPARETRELIQELADLSDLVTVGETGGRADDTADAAGSTLDPLRLMPAARASMDGRDGGVRRPSFSVGKPGEEPRVRFAGVPMGHEFTSLVLALLHVGGHPPKLATETIERIRALSGEYRFETYVSMSCHICPDVVQALNVLAALNPAIHHVMIDGGLYPGEVAARQVLGVPSVWLNGEPFTQGRVSVEEVLDRLDSGAAEREAAREAERIAGKAAFDLLVVGGGPAGAAAAIYAARKGIRTGVVSERFGGQVLDTLGIDNFISVSRTEGPRLAKALEEHVREHEVDILDRQRAAALVPAGADGLTEVRLASGAALRARTVVIATGARWREMNVPGEREYRGRGVAYCPHCDGPLFKGKRVAVIGGGNSGVEAAIDLAGLASHVTLVEFEEQLRADAVLQRKLSSLANVTVLRGVRTTEVTGDGSKVNGLVYADRHDGTTRGLELEGVFVQIGLLPNTDWLRGTVVLSQRGEIEVDARGQTSVPGVFAAGDVTAAPFKQIVIALGEGAKASLAAFEHLVRSPVPA